MLSTFDILTIDELRENLRKIEDKVNYYDCSTNKDKYIYLAGPWFKPTSDEMEKSIYNIYRKCYGKSPFKVFRPRTEGEKCKNTDGVFLGNIDAIKKSDLVLANISEKDVGTAFEIGYAMALKKKIILLGYDKSCFQKKTNLMLAFAGDACITIDKLWKVFTNNIDESDLVKFNVSWENIE